MRVASLSDGEASICDAVALGPQRERWLNRGSQTAPVLAAFGLLGLAVALVFPAPLTIPVGFLCLAADSFWFLTPYGFTRRHRDRSSWQERMFATPEIVGLAVTADGEFQDGAPYWTTEWRHIRCLQLNEGGFWITSAFGPLRIRRWIEGGEHAATVRSLAARYGPQAKLEV